MTLKPMNASPTKASTSKLKLFVTGTDTDVGKTVVAAALLQAANNKGLTTAAIKPVAAGCEWVHELDGEPGKEALHNSDALILQQAASEKLPYAQINPVALEPAIAPHIAAAEAGQRLQASRIAGFCRGVLMRGAGLTVIEGAGGWRVPLSERETFADLARELQVPVVLVVGMKLGCINHALLTAEAIRRDGLPLAGWVVNRVEPEMSRYDENVATLQRMIPAPLLGEIPHLESAEPAIAAEYLSIEPLLKSS